MIENSTLFPSAVHFRTARDYQAEADALDAEIERTRDEWRRSQLVARRDQKRRNAEVHLRLAQTT